MSKKIIGIKQADGSFFPILQDGEAANKTLEVTTVRDGQTTVKINLFKQYEETGSLEYVDTLLIEDLVPHLKEEPSFKLSINLDEDNVLTAEVLDPETGVKSDTSVSLVTLSEAQQGETTDFALADNTDLFDDIGTAEFENTDDLSSLPEFEDDISATVIDEDSFDNSSFSDDDISLEEADSIIDDSIETETDPISEDMDDFSFPADEEDSVAEESQEDDFGLNSTSINSLNMDGDDLSFPDDESIDLDNASLTESSDSFSTEDDFTFPEEAALHDDINPPGYDFDISSSETDESISESSDFMEDSLDSSSMDLGDDSFDSASMDLGDDTFDSASMDLGDDTFDSSSMDLGDDTFDSASMDLGDDAFDSTSMDLGDDTFDSTSMDLGDDTFSSDSLDLGDETSTDTIDFNSGFDLDSSDLSSMDLDSDIDSGSDEDFSFSSSIDEPEIQYEEHGQRDKKEEASTTFIPPLYDKKLKDDIEKRRSRRKYPLAMVVCIICALICIAAVILAFMFGSWPGENPSVINNVVSVEPPQVFEQERIEAQKEGIETKPPTLEENTIEVVVEEEVVPVKPAPAPVNGNIRYLIIWGDTLWDLSDTYYRNPWLYETLADANGISDPDYIIAGTHIDIPPR